MSSTRNVTKGLSLCHIYKNGRANGAPIHSIQFSPSDPNGRVVWPGKPRVAGVFAPNEFRMQRRPLNVAFVLHRTV